MNDFIPLKKKSLILNNKYHFAKQNVTFMILDILISVGTPIYYIRILTRKTVAIE